MANIDTAAYGVINQLTGKLVDAGTKEECDDKINSMRARENIRESYDLIRTILEKYVDMKPEYYKMVSLWIIGTYLHKEFESFPYLFFNAMRGSGKSRVLRLICKLAKDGNVMASPTEAVLFRTKGTLGVDEFEGIASKDKASIRELLNGAYKKGIKIMRMKKKKVLGQEEQVVEEFEPYRPVVMCNIYGMDEVLGDRCLTLILEKSVDPVKTRLIEDFEDNEDIIKIKDLLGVCSLCSVVTEKNIYKRWNMYNIERPNNTPNTLHTYNTHTTHTTHSHINMDKIFNKIYDSGIIGRNLELFLPLFFISRMVDDVVLDELVEIAVEMTQSKKSEEEMESVDVMVYDFISQRDEGLHWNSVKQLSNEFREFSDIGEEWLNAKWFGRALKRLNLVLDKKRIRSGIEVMLNVKKAKEKFKMFKK